MTVGIDVGVYVCASSRSVFSSFNVSKYSIRDYQWGQCPLMQYPLRTCVGYVGDGHCFKKGHLYNENQHHDVPFKQRSSSPICWQCAIQFVNRKYLLLVLPSSANSKYLSLFLRSFASVSLHRDLRTAFCITLLNFYPLLCISGGSIGRKLCVFVICMCYAWPDLWATLLNIAHWETASLCTSSASPSPDAGSSCHNHTHCAMGEVVSKECI